MALRSGAAELQKGAHRHGHGVVKRQGLLSLQTKVYAHSHLAPQARRLPQL